MQIMGVIIGYCVVRSHVHVCVNSLASKHMYACMYVYMYYYFMKEVTTSAEAGINGNTISSYILSTALLRQQLCVL